MMKPLPHHRWLALTGLALALVPALGCAGAVESSKREDQARREVPVPICLEALERHGEEGVVSALKPEDYWVMVLPSYDVPSGTVDVSANDCAGRPIFSRKEFIGAEGSRTGAIVAPAKNAVITPAADKFKIVWLRTHEFSEGVASGPLALVRPREGHAEVYAIGAYKGRPKHSRFSLERMGPRILVTASDEGCTKAKATDNCETTLIIYVMSAGKLNASAEIPLDRVQYGTAAGVTGPVQYKLTASPVFGEKSVRVIEQVVLTDSTETALRKSNIERVFTLKSRGELVANRPSLWEQLVGGGSQSAPESGDSEPPSGRE